MQSPLLQTVEVENFKAIGPYTAGKIVASRANLVYPSGQIGLVFETGELVSDSVEEQTAQAMKNLDAVLRAANSSLANSFKVTIYLVDMVDFPKVNTVYATFFKETYPARVCIAVHQLPKGAKVEIDAIAVQNE